ncbi:hypothetical protein [Streptomyces boluensis]|uniref:Uncharacterized protein n=1 Tax=Streptomyces boluensis TaxID=1775135 RepID=A0A964XLL5_9ACTN|nr:hypothetical protein [Streptomyces boluensis]NBE53455.1 hypothetical protein [Streptomyces boluensis]
MSSSGQACPHQRAPVRAVVRLLFGALALLGSGYALGVAAPRALAADAEYRAARPCGMGDPRGASDCVRWTPAVVEDAVTSTGRGTRRELTVRRPDGTLTVTMRGIRPVFAPARAATVSVRARPPAREQVFPGGRCGAVPYAGRGCDHLLAARGRLAATPDPTGVFACREVPQDLRVERVRTATREDPPRIPERWWVAECRDGRTPVLLACAPPHMAWALGALGAHGPGAAGLSDALGGGDAGLPGVRGGGDAGLPGVRGEGAAGLPGAAPSAPASTSRHQPHPL